MHPPLPLTEAIRLVCPTCGCAPVRLGVPRERWRWSAFEGRRYAFCCCGCQERFDADPERIAARTRDLVICPTCLGETPLGRADPGEYEGVRVYFCGCPACPEQFARRADGLIGRLTGRDPYPGVMGDLDACCTE
jgi:YHS domain-containing protein